MPHHPAARPGQGCLMGDCGVEVGEEMPGVLERRDEADLRHGS